MRNNPDMTEASLREKIKQYRDRVNQIEEYLAENPNDWGKFQNELIFEVDKVCQEIMDFEKYNISKGCEEKVYKLKRIFVEKIRFLFLRGELTDWILRKPYGYAGDFKIIEDIYENNPTTIGFDRLFDNYVQMSAISVAVRNRKNDFKRMIKDFVSTRNGAKTRIMTLASGPCREIRELYFENEELFKNVEFDCYDSDENSIVYASRLLEKNKRVKFIKENAARMAFRKDISSLIKEKYDLIYSTGLFDYFEERLSTKLISNLRKLLNLDGAIIISNVRDKYSNPSVHYMEWVGEWELVYCSDDDFRGYFINAGFELDEIQPGYEQQGILQYIYATNKTNSFESKV